MSTEENVETIQPVPVTPTPAVTEPAAPVTPVVEAAPATPIAEQPKHDKATAAFIKQRQERKADKLKIAELEGKLAAAQPAPAVTPPVQAPQAPVVSAPVQPQVVVPAETVDAVSESAAIQAMSLDKDVQSVPGAIMDIMEIVDSNPKIAKLNAIDSGLAFREAKAIWASNLGIAPTPVTPVATKVSGGMSGSPENLQALFAAVDAAKPGTKTFRDAVAKVNEAMNKRK
jgi:hypothetical protein